MVKEKTDGTTPYRSYIIKVASRCNIDCDYCYMYHSIDQSWRKQPRFLSASTTDQLARRLSDHVETHSLPGIEIVLHGGEPLLLGADRLNQFVEQVSSGVSCPISWSMQTNGILLSERFLDVFDRWDIHFGVSLDGGREDNDRHRTYRNGRSSFGRVTRGIELANSKPSWARLLSGALCVVDTRNSPRRILDTVKSLGFESVDLLLPDRHHDTPVQSVALGEEQVSYGNWLEQFFDIWFVEFPDIKVRYLETIIAMMLGGRSDLESLGAKSGTYAVIETNGDIEPLDVLKIAGRKYTRSNLNIANNSFDEAARELKRTSNSRKLDELCEECQNCSELSNCGGGYLPHRFSEANGFQNPSIYCGDLKALFKHIRYRIRLESSYPHKPR